MKFVAKCSASLTLSYQVHVKNCNPISLRSTKTLQIASTYSPHLSLHAETLEHVIYICDIPSYLKL